MRIEFLACLFIGGDMDPHMGAADVYGKLE